MKRQRHSSDMIGMDCSFCFNEITDCVEYKKNTTNEWFQSSICFECIMYLKRSQYGDYITQIQSTDCKRTLKRLLEMGPPLWVHDVNVFKNVDYENNENVIEFKCNDEIISARLEGSVDGEERKRLWDSLRNLRE